MEEPRSLQDIESIQSLDTARLALRWALEKIQSLEKDKAGLADKLNEEERGRARAQEDSISLQKTLGLRTAESSQRELYYAKLEEYLSLKLDGKLDPSVLAKRELEVSQLQEMLSQKQAYLEKDFAARKESLERDYQRARTETDAETRERIRRSEASLEARRALIEQELLSKNSEILDKKSEIEAQTGQLAERKKRFEEYYSEQRAQLHAALQGFREEIKEEVALRVQMAERILEERRESSDKIFSEERSLLIRELESWRSKVKELGPQNIDLERSLALSDEKFLRVQAQLDRAQILRQEERKVREVEKENLSQEAELWRKQVLALLEEARGLKERVGVFESRAQISEKESEDLRGRLKILSDELDASHKKGAESWECCVSAEDALREKSERLETLEQREKSNAIRMKKELDEFVERHEALSAEFKEARGRSADQMERLVELEKELSSSKQAAIDSGLKASRAQKEIDCLKNERAAADEEIVKMRREVEESFKKSLELERKTLEMEETLRHDGQARELEAARFSHEKNLWEKERQILEAHLKGYQSKLDARVKSEVAKSAGVSEPAGSLWPPIQWREKE